MTINDLELCKYQAVLRRHCKGLEELTAQARGADLMKAYAAIELAARLAQERLGEIRGRL